MMQCFQKDPNLRVSARKLLKHPWIVGCRRSDAPVSKRPADFNQAVEEVKQWNKALKSSETSLRASTSSDGSTPGAHGQPVSRFGAAAVDPHRQNLAAPGVKKSSNVNAAVTKAKPSAEMFRSPEVADDDNWDNDFATAISPSALHLPHLKPQDNFGGKFSADRLKQFASTEETNSRENWDDHFEGDLQTVKSSRQFFEQDLLEQTIRPMPRRSSRSTESSSTKSQVSGSAVSGSSASSGHKKSRSKQVSSSNVPLLQKDSSKPAISGGRFELPQRPETIYREQSTEDFSDLFPESDSLFSRKISRGGKVNTQAAQTSKPPSRESRTTMLTDVTMRQDSSQLMPPPDFKIEPATNNNQVTLSPGGAALDGLNLRRQRVVSRPSPLDDQPMRRTKSQIEIHKFAEGEDDEDFSDIFGPNDTLKEKEESDRGSDDGAAIMLLSKLSNGSWLGDDEDEDDPFAMMDPEYNELDLEANIARDRHARLAERVEELVQLLKIGTEITGEERVADVADELLHLLHENDDVKGLIISAHGLLPILELLTLPSDTISTAKSRQDMVLLLLRVVNKVQPESLASLELAIMLTFSRSFTTTESFKKTCASSVAFPLLLNLLPGNSLLIYAWKPQLLLSRCMRRLHSLCRCSSAAVVSLCSPAF